MTDSSESAGHRPPASFYTIVSFLAVAILLVQGRGFLVPLAVAVLIFILLTAVTDWLSKMTVGGRQVPRWIAHLLGIIIAFAGISTVFGVLSSQVRQVAAAVPRYRDRMTSLLERATEYFGEDKVVWVRDVINSIDFAGAATGLIGSAGALLGVFALVFLYCAFMMAERPRFDRKLQRLFPGRPEVKGAVAATALSVRRYIWVKTIVSGMTGLLSYAIMRLIGLDFAETWALLVFVLNFIPSIGSIIGTIFPALLALLQFDTLGPFLIVALGIGAIQFVIGNVIDPMLMGTSLNMSTFMIIVSLTFWGGIWGVPGMFMSVPITVVIMIACSHVERLHWIAILLSGDGDIAARESTD